MGFLEVEMYQRIHFAITPWIKLFWCSLTSAAPSFPSFWQLRWVAAWFDISCLEKRGRGWKLMISHYPVGRDQRPQLLISPFPPLPTSSFSLLHQCTPLYFSPVCDKQHLPRLMRNDQPQGCNIAMSNWPSANIWYHHFFSHIYHLHFKCDFWTPFA